MPAQTIDQVIDRLNEIIEESKVNESPMGYFAALYKNVTVTVKEKILAGYFDDNVRMEKLDVVFANRYIQAYDQFQNQLKTTGAWKVAFDACQSKKFIVMQHLLLGMNAHINLDLGIAAADISTPDSIDSLENDFKKINEVLSSLVVQVQDDLTEIYPFLVKVLKYTKNVDDFLVDFSMQLARDGAWKFAKELVMLEGFPRIQAMDARDVKVVNKAKIITDHGFLINTIFFFVRLSERGDTIAKITALQNLGLS